MRQLIKTGVLQLFCLHLYIVIALYLSSIFFPKLKHVNCYFMFSEYGTNLEQLKQGSLN